MAEPSYPSVLALVVVRKLASLRYQDMFLGRWLDREVDKLEDILMLILFLLFDAEHKQVENPDLTIWLRKVRDIFHDVDFVFDEFQCDALQQRIANNGGVKGKVCNFFSHSNPFAFPIRIVRVMKGIRLDLDKIKAEKDEFNLKVRDIDDNIIYSARDTDFCYFFSNSNPLSFHGKIPDIRFMVDEAEDGRIVQSKRNIYSYVDALDVIGRDDDKEKIIHLLQYTTGDESVSVLSIVGSGGLGKTTLAKLVYNDEKAERHFQLRMWACVPVEGFDVKNLIKKIVSTVVGVDCGDLTLDQMQTHLRDALHDKRFLLVLDNVLNEDGAEWVEFKHLLSVAANGSKIIVTTRSQSVADIMSTAPEYKHMLTGLSHKDCMSLFTKWTFRKGEDTQYPNLLRIGEKLVKRCAGVPLALKILGCLLYSKIDNKDWLIVANSEIWKLKEDSNIFPALRLSYDTMPDYLKNCFAFCSVFPKGYEFNNFELIQLWMAHGFLTLPRDKQQQEVEDIAQKSLKELWSRSFFQDFEDLGGSVVFKMHDLVHDFALSLAEGECSTISFRTRNISNRLRHMSFFYDDSSMVEVLLTLSVRQWKNVQTLICREKHSSDSSIETCVSRFNHMRVLDLSGSGIDLMPNSLGKLRHLRYLSISSTEKLPSSICRLVNLQTLNLMGCKELPRDIGKLIRLRCLWLTTKQVVLPEKGIGCLTSLRFLYIGECCNLKSMGEEMQSLTSLRTLYIVNCNHLCSLPRSMKCLTALETLVIGACEKLNLMEPEGDIQGLKLGLRSLVLGMLPKLVALPPWLQGAASTLQTINIESCFGFKELPEWLQNLTSLQKLVIERCHQLSTLPEGMHCLTALRELKIKRCPKLATRCKRETGEDWPKIARIPQITIGKITSDEDGEGEEEEEVINNYVSSPDEMGGKGDERVDSKEWPPKNQFEFLRILNQHVKDQKNQPSTFKRKEWEQIDDQLEAIVGEKYGVERLKSKFNRLHKQHCEFSELLLHTGVTYNIELNIVEAAEDVWQMFYKKNKSFRQFRKKGLDHYQLLGEIFKNTTETRKLLHASTQKPPTSSKEHEMEDDFLSNRSLTSKEEASKPKAEKYRVQSSTSKLSDPYSIEECMDILESIDGLDFAYFNEALKKFKDSDWRKMFVKMSVQRRRQWLVSLLPWFHV